MDFGFSQEQDLLRATARKFFENECTSEFVRKRMEEPAGVTDQFWKALAEQGWTGLVYPEEDGGIVLTGTKLFVPDAHIADVIVVARTAEGKNSEDGVSLFLVPKKTAGLEVKLLPTMDQTRKLCEVKLTDVRVPADAVMGAPGPGWAPPARVIQRA